VDLAGALEIGWYLGFMTQGTSREKSRRHKWLLEECEKLRQECNQLTEGQREKARQRALQIIYGTNATTPAGRR
jgi:hypothetical protein